MRVAPSIRLVFTSIVGLAIGGSGCDELEEPLVGELQEATCADVDSNPAVPVVFHTDIRPLFDGKVAGTAGCETCHYETVGTHEGILLTGLDLEKLQSLRKGGVSTPPSTIVVPGKPCSSALVKKLQGTFTGARMPKGGPYWDEAKIQLVIDWIAEGALGDDE
jgi:hypothetical protein